MSSVDDEFLGFSNFLAVSTADASPVEVDAAAQWETTACGEIPWDSIEAIGIAAVLGMCPKKTAGEVKHFERELTVATRTIVGEQEGSLRFGRVNTGSKVE